MTRALYLCFFVFCLCTLSFETSNADQSTDQINALLTNKGWSAQQPMDIREDGTYHEMQYLLEKKKESIKPEFVKEKIRHVHKFLSCQYAFLFMTIADHKISVGRQCKMLKDPTELFKCLMVSHLQNIKDSDQLVLRMTSALLYFYKQFPDVAFSRSVTEILEYFKSYYSHKALSKLQSDYEKNGEIKSLKVAVYIQEIEDVLTSVRRLLRMFFINNCKLAIHFDRLTNVFFYDSHAIKNFDSQTIPPLDSVNEINARLNKMAEEFVSSNSSLGFIFDPTSGTTSVQNSCASQIWTKDIIDKRVIQLNNLINNPEWKSLDYYGTDVGIIDLQKRYYLHELFKANPSGQVVTYENYNTKFWQVHQGLSCKFARTIKNYIDYGKGLGLHCKRMSNTIFSVRCLLTVLQAIKKSDALVTPMKCFFSYLYQMFPQTPYKTDISVIVDYIESYSDNITFVTPVFENYSPSIDSDMVLNELKSIDNNLSFIESHLSSFLMNFCLMEHIRDSGRVISKATAYVQSVSELYRKSSPTDSLQLLEEAMKSEVNKFKSHYIKYDFYYPFQCSLA